MAHCNTKRKGVNDHVHDHHFSDFPLSSPPTKIRRLDPHQYHHQPHSEPQTNHQRAVVLFKPLLSPPSFALTLDSAIISAIKDKIRWSAQADPITSAERNDNLAVVPWVASQFPPNSPTSHVSNTDAPDLMDVELEEDSSNSSIHPTLEGGNARERGEAVHQWQQRHCLLPQLPHSTSVPITWT